MSADTHVTIGGAISSLGKIIASFGVAVPILIPIGMAVSALGSVWAGYYGKGVDAPK